jgi:hypothetical protein
MVIDFPAGCPAIVGSKTLLFPDQFGNELRKGAMTDVMQVPLQSGDSGVQKLETYTITATGTGTANFIIARRLGVFDVRVANAMDAQAWDMIGGPIVYADSCLWPVVVPDSTSSGTPTLDLDIING